MASATGWSVEYILEDVNYQTLIMMLSDAPRYVRSGKNQKDPEQNPEEEADKILGFFQSQLK